MSLGIYISVPFCRSKCTYCNFASGVFSSARMARYVERLNEDVKACREFAGRHRAEIPEPCDSIYLGGGTPTLLQPKELEKLFFILREHFVVSSRPEITVECAPGTLTEEIVATFRNCGVNRVSLGVQSFVDKEAASVARLHTREQTLGEIERLRAAGIGNVNVDLIAGLPYQTRESWEYSLGQAIASGVPHVSVYMLEIDEDSRLGRELIAGGTRYHAHFVPDEDLTAEFYETACARLEAAGIEQYEISNFAREGFASSHNLKYWTRQPYLGFGVDAHSMLPGTAQLRADGLESLRFATTDSFDEFFSSPQLSVSPVHMAQALEESFFLGLRLNEGIDLERLRKQFGARFNGYSAAIAEELSDGLLAREGDHIRLTPRGRLLSNEVFSKFVHDDQPAGRVEDPSPSMAHGR
ncbi:MAG TPA: radical SAM family heme chaperone HemW [Candidatus Angelobacter sp.]|nr:radical SAM family heme chaperone HemW [Candidatus Angelobacter sp.]